jgi:hypothetical protein
MLLLYITRNHRDAQAMDPSARFVEWRRCQIRARLFKEHACVNGNDIAVALHTPDILTSEIDSRLYFQDNFGETWFTAPGISEILFRIFKLDKLESSTEFIKLLDEIFPDLAADLERERTQDCVRVRFVKYNVNKYDNTSN